MERRNFIKTVICGFSVLVAAGAGGRYIYEFADSKKLPGDEFWSKNKHIEHLDIHLVEHCNLNCKYCYHFSCVAEEEYTDIKDFEKNLKRLSEVTEQRVKRIYLDGGEPLLHPDAADFLPIARKYFPFTEINLVTNGLLLMSMKEDFWKVMHDNNIVLNHSPYPVKVDIDGYYEKASKYKVKTDKTKNFIKNNPVQEFGKIGLHPKGDLDYKETWAMCDCKNRCAQLVSGKIFACPAVAYIRHFNKKFGYNIETDEKDFVDIFKIKGIDDILSFYKTPFPFCKYCKGFIAAMPWEESNEHSASEWLDEE